MSINKKQVEANAMYASAMSNACNYNKWIVSRFRPYFGESILEVGIGHGGFFPLLPHVQGYAGIDINEELICHARRLNPGQDYYQGDITNSNLPETLKNKMFDSVLCVNVLEHIKDDAQSIINLFRVINAGGYLLLFVPAFPRLYNDLDRLAGHYRRYTKKTLTSLIHSMPHTTIVKCQYFNPLGGIGWWANKWVYHSSLENEMLNNQIKYFDKIALPFSRMLDFFTRFFFGQSLIAVVRKQ